MPCTIWLARKGPNGAYQGASPQSFPSPSYSRTLSASDPPSRSSTSSLLDEERGVVSEGDQVEPPAGTLSQIHSRVDRIHPEGGDHRAGEAEHDLFSPVSLDDVP